MGRTPKPYTTYQRDDGTWYYTINWSSGVPRSLCERRKSTGIRTAARASDPPAVTRFIQKRIEQLRSAPADARTFGEYAQAFYTDRCPHRARVGRERISEETLHNRRQIFEKHIVTDPIWKADLGSLTPSDVALCRERQFAKGLAKGSVKRIMDMVRTVLHEATINRVLLWNPAQAVPRLDRTPDAPRGIFSVEELRAMFAGDRPGPWGSAWLMFRIAAVTGMRSAEVRALTWEQIKEDRIIVDAAWKGDGGRRGKPKWGIVREIPLPWFLADEIERYGNRSYQWVVASEIGSSYSSASWRERWIEALEALEIPRVDPQGRPRPPHSLRHSLRTHMAAYGVADSVAATVLGHEQPGTAVDRGYLTLRAEQMEAVSRFQTDLFGPDRVPGLRLLQPSPRPTRESGRAAGA